MSETASTVLPSASPPLHSSWTVRGINVPNFSAFQPKNIRVTSSGSLLRALWSCDGKKVAVCGTEKLARLWVPEKSFDIRNTIALSNGHTEIVDSCAWNPTHPELLCSASSKDMRIVFWDARTKTPLQTVSLKPRQPVDVKYSPNGRVLAVLDKANFIVFLTLERKEDGKDHWVLSQERVKGHNESETEVISFVWNHPGDCLILGEKAGLLTYVTYPELAFGTSSGAHMGGATCIAIDPRGKYIATCGPDSIVNLFDIASWRVSRSLDCTEDVVNDIDFSFDGEFLAIAFASSLEIWAVETGECLHKVTSPNTPCRTVSWHPWKYVLAFGGQSFQDPTPNTRSQPQAAMLSFFGL
ncbi:WD40 repeat-like protein [Sistotremastrum niveocremeum HHB9708]|uniref:WD40 repeat-like protein n=1 Tax=Sistotremastrum niveocremeum HHB9708 TaxID=1314777 RepID=A0A164ZM23_9AGAM|nr:WD40 repeat-like protein [Sistotremastrum niveocremeum HHB9708]